MIEAVGNLVLKIASQRMVIMIVMVMVMNIIVNTDIHTPARTCCACV